MARQSESKVLCRIIQWGYSRPSLTQTVVVLLVLCGLALAGESVVASRVVVVGVVVVLVLPVTVAIHLFAARGAPVPPLALGLRVSSPQVREHEKKEDAPKSMSAGQSS